MVSRSFRRGFALLGALACVALPAVGSAQSDAGEIVVDVIDAKTKQPLEDARVFLLGAQTANSLTTVAGKIDYTDVPTGIYRVRVTRRGYDGARSREFDVLVDRAVHLRIALASSLHAEPQSGDASSLRIIARVSANIQITSNDIADESPIRRLSTSLTDALDQLAGVSVTQDATDPSSAVTVSLNNEDESQTEVTLDGIPLSGPGTSANLRAIGTDLFSGSSVSFGANAGGLAGGVNFRTLAPTQSLQFRGNGTTGTYDRSNYGIAFTGSIDSLGIAVQHTWRGSNSPLTFRDYLDQSGLNYAHEGESTARGDFIKLRYRLGDDRTTIGSTLLTNNRAATAICAQDVTLLPCGIGPGNGNVGRFGFGDVSIQSLVGNVSTSLSGYISTSTQTTDDSNRYVLDAPATLDPLVAVNEPVNCATATTYAECLDPSLQANTTLTRGLAYSASIAEKRHTIALSGSSYQAINANVPTAGSIFERAYTNDVSSTQTTFSDTFKSSDRLTLSPHLSLVTTSGVGTNVLAGFGVGWRPSATDAFAASIDAGSSQPSVSVNRSFSDPVSASFNCGAGTAVVGGPGDTATGKQSAFSVSANWTHTLRFGTLSARASSQIQAGQVIGALIAEPAGYFASVPGYIGAVTAAYQSPSVCGTAAAAPTIYVDESIAGTRRLYQSIDLSGRFGISKYVVLLPTYTLAKAELTGAGSRLLDGPSTSVVGAQLPNRPLHRAGLTADGYLPRSGIELLGSVQYTGSNNQQHLGPYATVSAGLSHRFGPGQVTLFENNVFNTDAGVFATDSGAVPLALSSGGSYLGVSRPLLPRTINLSYTTTIGGPRPGPAFASVAKLPVDAPSATPAPATAAAAAPGASPPPGGRFTAVPPPPGVDPLALATARSSCTSDAVKAATPVFAELRADVAAFGAGAAPPANATFELVKHDAHVDPTVPYYLALRPKFRGPGGARGAGAASGMNAAGGAGLGTGRIRGGGGFGGGGFGGGGGGGEGGAPPAGAPEGTDNDPGAARGEPTSAQREALRTNPAAIAFRSFTSCAYLSVLTAQEAAAKGIATEPGRPGLVYVPGIGLTFVRPPELPKGGGSVKR